ncbi:MAG: hypothetical protein H7251_00135, partial [Acetobacteraceae bacterium]|nr:hypothetical protein [Acetobacteraceae bacterium]
MLSIADIADLAGIARMTSAEVGDQNSGVQGEVDPLGMDRDARYHPTQQGP